MEHRFPVVLGKDFAGVVDAVGPGVSEYQVGDRVFGVVTKPYLGDGSFAEYVTVPTEIGLARLPDAVDFRTGATLGLAGAAAISALDAAEVQPGQRVLVVGATGGVGNQTVQLAAKAGAQVVATAATHGEKELVMALGAHTTVDHTGNLVDAVRQVDPDGVDVVFHFAGDPVPLVAAVRPGGRFVSTMLGSPEQLTSEHATVAAICAHPDPATLDRAARHHVEGTRVRIQDDFPLEKAPDAFAAFAAGTLGKLVITVA